MFEHKDWSQEDPRDAAAGQAGINYIGLDGSIGCMGQLNIIIGKNVRGFFETEF